jgi:hypothetical protein
MTQEQKEYLKEMVKFRALNPFDNGEEYDLKKMEELRCVISEGLKHYKELKKRIEQRRIDNKRLEELLKAIDSLQSSE